MSAQQVTKAKAWELLVGVGGERWVPAPRGVPGHARPVVPSTLLEVGRELHWHLIGARPRAGAVASIDVEVDVHGGQQWVANIVFNWLNFESGGMTWEPMSCPSEQDWHIGTGAVPTPSFEALRVQGCCREAVVSRVMTLLSPRAGRPTVLACQTGEAASQCRQPLNPAQTHQLVIPRTARWTPTLGTRAYTSSHARSRATGGVPCSSRSYGGRCWMCKRRLKDPVSIALGIGPVCRGRYERRRAQAPAAGPR